MNPPPEQKPAPPGYPRERLFEVDRNPRANPSDNFLLHTFIILGVLALVVGVSLLGYLAYRPDGELCNGADYDFALCQVQRVQTCEAMAVLTRQECIDLLGSK